MLLPWLTNPSSKLVPSQLSLSTGSCPSPSTGWVEAQSCYGCTDPSRSQKYAKLGISKVLTCCLDSIHSLINNLCAMMVAEKDFHCKTGHFEEDW